MTNSAQATQGTTTIVVQNQSATLGIGATVCGVISIFFLAVIFGTLGLILGVLGLIKKQYVFSVIGILASIFGLMTSPILYALIGLGQF
ncbi:MAG: hypothetical protein R3E44_08310 [Paracoccaceae bacterium]